MGLRDVLGDSGWAAERTMNDRYVAEARAQMDEASWRAALDEGQAMSLEEAVEYALSEG